MKYRSDIKEFKLDALNLVKTNGYAATSRELRVSEMVLRSWAKKYKFSRQSDGQEVFEVAEVMEPNRELKRRVNELEKANYILRKAAAFFSFGKREVIYQMINSLYEEKRMRVASGCKVLGVSRSGYYKWRNEMLAKTQLEQRHCGEITEAWEDSSRTYGAPRSYSELLPKRLSISQKKVARLMKKQGISGAGKKSSSCCTTDSAHSHEVVARHFKTEVDPVPALSTNKVWGGDITSIRLQRGFCFLAVYKDVALRKIVGYSVRDTLQAEGAIEALKMAIGKEHLVAGLIVHTDQGVQYACGSYRALIELYGYKMSMSRKGNCYDNAFIESFFRSLKVELIHRQVFKTSQEAQAAIFHYIEVWYNRQRRHSSLAYMSPVDYDRLDYGTYTFLCPLFGTRSVRISWHVLSLVY